MRALLAAVILIAASIAPAHAGNEFSNAADFLKAWDTDDNNLYLRIYIRGVGDGMGFWVGCCYHLIFIRRTHQAQNAPAGGAGDHGFRIAHRGVWVSHRCWRRSSTGRNRPRGRYVIRASRGYGRACGGGGWMPRFSACFDARRQNAEIVSTRQLSHYCQHVFRRDSKLSCFQIKPAADTCNTGAQLGVRALKFVAYRPSAAVIG